MIVDIRQLEDIRFRFTELGIALTDLSEKNAQTFEDLLKSLKTVDDSIGGLDLTEFKNVKGVSQAISLNAQNLLSIFDKISLSLGTPLDTLSVSMKGASDLFGRIKTELSDFRLPTSYDGKEVGKKKEDKKKDEQGKLGGYLEKEKQGIKSRIEGGAAALKIPLPGGFFGGALLIAAWGLKERDRVKQEVGESLNIVESAFDSGVKNMVQKAANYLGTLGDQMNKFYGIPKENVQAVAKEYVEGGIKIRSMFESVDKSFGVIGRNYVTFALGLDKMFNLSSGESAKKTVELMVDYGKSLEGARKSWMNMLMAGKDSGLGTSRFVKNVITAADSLKELGYDIDNVVNLAVGLQAAYQDMGVPRQMAGQQAALGLQQLAQGMTSMSDAWKRLVGEEMGLGSGIEAKQKFEDAVNRITTRSDSEEADLELQNAIMAMIRVASRGGQEGEVITREILSSEMGLGFKGSQAAMAIKKAVDSGDLKKALSVTQENRRILVNAFQTESEKQNVWQRHMNQWLQGVSKIGQGIIGMVGHGLATLIAYFKAFIPLISNYITKDTEANQNILDAIDGFTRQSAGYGKYFKSGFDDLKKASINAGMEVFGDSLDALKSAISFNPFSPEQKTGMPERTPIASQKGFKLQGAVGMPLDLGTAPQPLPISIGDKPQRVIPDRVPVEPMIRTIVIPGGEPGVYPVTPVDQREPSFDYSTPQLSSFMDGPQLIEGAPNVTTLDWAGGGLSIVNKSVGGVTASGDIILEVVGNCPRCGLIFGEDYSQLNNYDRVEMPVFSEGDEVALARMLTSEVGSSRELEGATKTEAIGIAYTAINRLRSGKYGGSTLREVITGGEGFGVQGTTKRGKMRPYSTKREATTEALKLAREVMSGYYADPTGGATYFYHSTRGKGYGSKKHPELRTALPRFTSGKVNTLNINSASFWANKQLAKQRAADANEWQAKEEARFERVHRQTKPKEPTVTEDWELETGMTPMI